jgi:hypothetical protein
MGVVRNLYDSQSEIRVHIIFDAHFLEIIYSASDLIQSSDIFPKSSDSFPRNSSPQHLTQALVT